MCISSKYLNSAQIFNLHHAIINKNNNNMNFCCFTNTSCTNQQQERMAKYNLCQMNMSCVSGSSGYNAINGIMHLSINEKIIVQYNSCEKNVSCVVVDTGYLAL